jgi:hypothetical protein
VYSRALNANEVARVAGYANRLAPRETRVELMSLPFLSQIVFICPRDGGKGKTKS